MAALFPAIGYLPPQYLAACSLHHMSTDAIAGSKRTSSLWPAAAYFTAKLCFFAQINIDPFTFWADHSWSVEQRYK